MASFIRQLAFGVPPFDPAFLPALPAVRSTPGEISTAAQEQNFTCNQFQLLVRTHRHVLTISGYSRIQLSLCTHSLYSRISGALPHGKGPPPSSASHAPAEKTSHGCLSVAYVHTTPPSKSARAGGDARRE
ncbi:hypothetical protein B0H11DRAFT_2259318 [Mycena galericulata]|nr:hypothetical protein B0H11DRAFT_2259318 [Mycena galericulata]